MNYVKYNRLIYCTSKVIEETNYKNGGLNMRRKGGKYEISGVWGQQTEKVKAIDGLTRVTRLTQDSWVQWRLSTPQIILCYWREEQGEEKGWKGRRGQGDKCNPDGRVRTKAAEGWLVCVTVNDMIRTISNWT